MPHYTAALDKSRDVTALEAGKENLFVGHLVVDGKVGNLSPLYAPRVVLPAQLAVISQRLPQGKPPRREGKSGIKPCSHQ